MQDCSSNVSNRLFSFEENFVSNGAQIVSVCFQICKLFSMVHIVCDQIWKIVFNVPNCLFSGLQKKNSGAFVLFSNLKNDFSAVQKPNKIFFNCFFFVAKWYFPTLQTSCSQGCTNYFQCFFFFFSVLLNVFQPRKIVFTVARVSCAALQKFCYQGCKWIFLSGGAGLCGPTDPRAALAAGARSLLRLVINTSVQYSYRVIVLNTDGSAILHMDTHTQNMPPTMYLLKFNAPRDIAERSNWNNKSQFPNNLSCISFSQANS